MKSEEDFKKGGGKECTSTNDCTWCNKNPCVVFSLEEYKLGLLNQLNNPQKVILSEQEKQNFVIEGMMKHLHGEKEAAEGLCILPVCVTADILKHFSIGDAVADMLGDMI